MKFRHESVEKIALALLLLALASCDDIEASLPHAFGGNEVPPEVMAEPRAVQVPAGPANTTWQRLGDVPFKPKDFTLPPMIDASKKEMQNDRTEAEGMQQQYENQ
jgi:hypothetical protein